MRNTKTKKILGLDLGSNSLGWALLEEENGIPCAVVDLGCRIFTKAVEEKVPTPKNVKRRQMRLSRRVIQRRARRKRQMLNYLVALNLLPAELQGNTQPEKLLNKIGNPYALRTKGLDEKLSPCEFGRVLLHFAARRGFLSSKKQVAGDLADDLDTIEYLAKEEEEEKQTRKNKSKKPETDGDKKEEEGFKADIAEVYHSIKNNNCRTLGEYLHKLENGECQRNRLHAGGHLRTERAMYQDELAQIWKKQAPHFTHLPDNFMTDNKGVKRIIFYQRPLKLKKDRVGKCSLEPKNYRANMARLEVQKFRYLQIINNLKYFDIFQEKYISLSDEQKQNLKPLFDNNSIVTVAKIKKELGLERKLNFDGDETSFKGNTTACEIRSVIGDAWDRYTDEKQKLLFEDLFTIKKKSALKNRLIKYWNFNTQTAIELCLLEFEPSHSNLSLKAINKLLPYLKQGMIYNQKDMETGEIGALQAAGYGYEREEIEIQEKLSAPLETSNPIVNRGLHELKRVVNAIIKQHGKPDIVRIEMARDLEMNTQRVKGFIAQQKKNEKANQTAQEAFEGLSLGKKYASRDEKIKYRLWQDQNKLCAYSGKTIALSQVFSADTEIDHILPYKKSLDDSYMNKALCFVAKNREKRDRTPIDAWEGATEKWNQITQAINKWDKSLKSKVMRFYQTEADLQDRDFIDNQLNDTRYISRLALKYVEQLGCDVSVTKGLVVSEIRHQWGFNTLLGEADKKERTDHRHHAIDAVVIAATSRRMYQKAVAQIEHSKLKIDPPYPCIRKDLAKKLNNIIVSHTPQRKISGGLHEKTGAGYIEKHGGLVYRKALKDPKLNPSKIVDETVRKIVENHISKYNSSKEAFADTVYHKDGKTPIKRVRVLQSSIKTTKKQTAEDILAQTKFGVKDKLGKVFRWMVYGNTHHVEIIRHKQTGKITGEFVTMMLASHRAKGINMPKQPIIKIDHGEDYEFLMALHINDMVSVVDENGDRVFYRIQKLDSGINRIMLRLATATKIDKKEQEIHLAINKGNFNKYKIQLYYINAIGYPIND